jgi:DNA-directed RNA polymerase subunit RPC12/RpoP
MPRENYVPPVRYQPEGPANNNSASRNVTITNGINGTIPANAATKSQSRFDRAPYDTPDQRVYYVCGACNTTSGFKANDNLRCLNCGGKTLYKPRAKQ